MDISYYGVLNKFRVLYGNRAFANRGIVRANQMVVMPEYGNKLIYEMLSKDEPVMIARLGTTETGATINHLGVVENNRNVIKYIKGRTLPWFWCYGTKVSMPRNAGFFPATQDNLAKFGKMMIEDMAQADIQIWLTHEEKWYEKYIPNVKRIDLTSAEPFFATNPWTRILEGKKVLVVHPMAETIQKQHPHLNKIFSDGMMPRFDLQTIKAVQSLGGESNGFKDWFEALQWMKDEISKCDFDICLIGCGAYGYPLAAHVKRIGKKAVHLGGSIQLLFGIKGKRWEWDKFLPFANMYNEYWVRPSSEEKPKTADQVEGGCYW